MFEYGNETTRQCTSAISPAIRARPHAEIDLHAARRPLEPHVPLAIRHAAVRLAPPVHVTHRGRILAVVIRLRQQTVVHAPDRVPLLPGQQTIGLQPLVHQMRVRVDLRPVPAIRLRLGRAILHIRVLRDRPAIHVKTPRYLRARHSLPVESPDILHNGHRYRHVPFLPERRPAATGRIKTDWQLGNIQAAAPMPITSPGNDDDTGENHQPTLRKNTAEPVEQTLKQNTRADPRLSDRLMNGEVPCRLTARASPFASHGPRLRRRRRARNGRAGRATDSDDRRGTYGRGKGRGKGHGRNDGRARGGPHAPRTVPGRRAKAASRTLGRATDSRPSDARCGG